MEKRNFLEIPFIPLRGLTIFPGSVVSFALGRQKSIDALEKAVANDEKVFLVMQKDAKVMEPGIDDIYKIGTLAKVKQVVKLPGNMTHIIVEGLVRARIIEDQIDNDSVVIKVEEIDYDIDCEEYEAEAMMRTALEVYEDYIKLNSKSVATETTENAITVEKPGVLADVICANLMIKQNKRQEILEILDPLERLAFVSRILNQEVEILKIKSDIDKKVKEKVDKQQKEYYLREQIKVIQEELGDKDGIQADVERYEKKAKQKKLPKKVKDVFEKELNKFKRIQPSSPESNVVRNYIECILDLPWNESTKESYNLTDAQKILNEDHYGLDKVKERIIEFLAVRKNVGNKDVNIICLVGPPGVGKTSIVKSIARAVNRKYIRMSLGGVKDESEIRGHRKTYVGAMPGRIINAMKQAGVVNPLILFDEIDKLSSSYNGDPASAMLEVLDGEQNNTFRDHYLEIPYDLSKVLFICTANSIDTIPAPLRDRMEIIELSSYTSIEKKQIAIKYLYPKQLEKNGLTKENLKISDSVMEEIISSYTKEAGVRQLERVIGKICRKAVVELERGRKKTVKITKENLQSYLGTKRFRYEKIFDESQIGIVRGLAWTRVGGDTLSIEVNTMKGSGKLELTGSLGDVMKESAKAAISFIRSKSEEFNIDSDFYKNTDIHIHIPEGAVPKDGPSAGITMATAIVSALSGAKIRNDVAMTGEITIRGRVLPIGGLKEKVIAAKRAGISKVILPYDNQGDLSEIPNEIKEGMEFVLAKEMKDVIDNVVFEGEKIWK